MSANAELPSELTTGNGDSRALPPYTQNLLRIKLPVMVTLAHKKQPIRSIIELVPGAIIQFSKSCEEMLDLEVGGEPVALGECVKVGDKFGLRVTSVVLPDERFKPVGPSGEDRHIFPGTT